MGAVLYFVFV